jgi:hypothetical protein
MKEHDRPIEIEVEEDVRPIEIEVEEDVRKLAGYMAASFPAEKLVGIARAIAEIAPSLWGQYGALPVRPLRMRSEPISVSTQSITLDPLRGNTYP